MYAVEFRTKIKNGMIELPRKLKGSITDAVKVIILKEEPAAQEINAGPGMPDMIDKLLSSPLEIQGFKPLKRDESHAR